MKRVFKLLLVSALSANSLASGRDGAGAVDAAHCKSGVRKDRLPAPIGDVTMTAPGELKVEFRLPAPGGGVGHALKVVKAGEPLYKKILDHVCGLKIGESKLIYPLDD